LHGLTFEIKEEEKGREERSIIFYLIWHITGGKG